MILARLALSACLVVGTMASLSAPATAAGPTGIGGLNSNGGNIHHVRDRRGHHGRGNGRHYRGGNRGGGHVARGGGHRGGGHVGRGGGGHRGGGHVARGGGRHYGGGHGRRGRDGSGAFIAGAIVGGLLGWNSGYGYPRAQHHRYQQYHRSSHIGGSGCHPVSKFGYWHGRAAKVGGTMCYNGYGQGYVVSGSRYLIHYR